MYVYMYVCVCVYVCVCWMRDGAGKSRPYVCATTTQMGRSHFNFLSAIKYLRQVDTREGRHSRQRGGGGGGFIDQLACCGCSRLGFSFPSLFAPEEFIDGSEQQQIKFCSGY